MNNAEIRYGTLTEVAAPNEMPRSALIKIAGMGYGVKVGTLTQVDERSWNAIEVAAPDIAAQIVGAYLHDVTTDTGYVESDPSDRHPFPVDIPHGHIIYANILTDNIGDVALKMRVLIELIDPDGIVRHSLWTGTFTVSPGGSMASRSIPHTELDRAGTWVLRGVIEGEPA